MVPISVAVDCVDRPGGFRVGQARGFDGENAATMYKKADDAGMNPLSTGSARCGKLTGFGAFERS
jgi:hypothetical protein